MKANYTPPEMCGICKQPIDVEPSGWTKGHNAHPVMDGRCCDLCNQMYVIPERINQMLGGSDGSKPSIR